VRCQIHFETAVDSLARLMLAAAAEENTETKRKLGADFAALFEKTLKQPHSFEHDFDGIPHIGTLASPDGKLKIYTWRIPGRDGRSEYHGIIQRRRQTENDSVFDVFVLKDCKAEANAPETKTFEFPDWFGCIYYDMAEKHDRNQTIYTLIGFDFNDGISYKKYIDVLTFDQQGSPMFGLPLFIDSREGAKKRVIFEYTSQSVMLVRYVRELDKLVFNYLYPIVPEKAGDASYYVPDVTYDGYEYKFGKWLKVKNVPMIKKDEDFPKPVPPNRIERNA
jgi:hypothetical protein